MTNRNLGYLVFTLSGLLISIAFIFQYESILEGVTALAGLSLDSFIVGIFCIWVVGGIADDLERNRIT